MENLSLINQNLIEAFDNGILILDQRGVIIACNSFLVRLTGVKKEALLGQSCFPGINLPGRPLTKELMLLVKETFQTGQELSEVEIKTVSEKGYPSFYQFSSKIIQDQKNDLRWVIGIIQDKTRERELEQVVQQREKCEMVSQLAAGAAHEIKNPLTSVRGFIQLLQKDFLGTPKAEYLEIMIDEIDRVTRIAHDLMFLAKPAQPKMARYSIENIIREILMLVESEAKLRRVTITLQTSPGLHQVQVDKEQIKQVLLNLVKNAIEAMPLGGKLFLRITPAGYKINIIIIDQGVGMDDQTLKKVSRPFFTTKENGTGLGLAISQQILNNHGGKMVMKSKLHQGTKILLQLPIVPEA